MSEEHQVITVTSDPLVISAADNIFHIDLREGVSQLVYPEYGLDSGIMSNETESFVSSEDL